ncbi:MAG: hypothetical protein IT175_06545 [Acidobacteria bacterium]|nr:hypothetical protein [Acidobacteriota bacterium]
MPRAKKDPADAVAALLDSVSTKPSTRRGRPKGSKNKPKVAPQAPKRRGRPKGSKNKPKVSKAAPVKAAAARPVVRRRRRRTAKAPVEQTLSQRVDAMISELEKLRAEVGQLERFREVLKAINP